MSALGTCAVCGKQITRRFLVCQACEEAYGLQGPYSTWPEWVKRLVRDHRRERYGERKRLGLMESSFADLGLGSVEDLDRRYKVIGVW